MANLRPLVGRVVVAEMRSGRTFEGVLARNLRGGFTVGFHPIVRRAVVSIEVLR